MNRYYVTFAHGAGEKLQKITNAIWNAVFEHSFNTNFEKCTEMLPFAVYGYNAEKEC